MKAKPTLLLLFALASFAATGRAQTPSGAGGGAAHPLSEAQRQALKSVKTEGEKRAAPLAVQLAATVKQIYENMLSEKEDEALRLRLSKEMDETMSKLLAVKGQSVREMVAVLTPAQKQIVREEMRKPGAPGDLSELIERLFSAPEQ
jgi:exonuclease VII large subunit